MIGKRVRRGSPMKSRLYPQIVDARGLIIADPRSWRKRSCGSPSSRAPATILRRPSQRSAMLGGASVSNGLKGRPVRSTARDEGDGHVRCGIAARPNMMVMFLSPTLVITLASLHPFTPSCQSFGGGMTAQSSGPSKMHLSLAGITVNPSRFDRKSENMLDSGVIGHYDPTGRTGVKIGGFAS